MTLDSGLIRSMAVWLLADGLAGAGRQSGDSRTVPHHTI